MPQIAHVGKHNWENYKQISLDFIMYYKNTTVCAEKVEKDFFFFYLCLAIVGFSKKDVC